MAKRKSRKASVLRPKTRLSGWQPNYWMITAFIAIFFAGGFMIKAFFQAAPGTSSGALNYRNDSGKDSVLEDQVRLVAANFRCACGGCGELFLIDCTCDMPRGAKEEKEFIRRNLQQGLSVDEVITRVAKEYGHRIS